MGDPINDGFIDMCRSRIGNSFMAMQFATEFCRMEPQFNSHTRIELAFFSDKKMLLAADDSYLREPACVTVPAPGVKAWLQRTRYALLHALGIKNRWRYAMQGWKREPSPYASYPMRRVLPVKSAARQWMRRQADPVFNNGPHGIWAPSATRWGDEVAIAKVWYVYDGLTDTLYIEWNRDSLR